MSTIHETIHILEEFYKWRRGDETFIMPEPFELGVAIGDALRLLREHENLRDEVERLKKDNINMSAWICSKMYEPEWDSFKKSLEVIDHWKARAEKAENELAAAKVEIENLVWNLAGCSVIAESGKPTDYSQELARPALHDVNKLAARAEKAEAELTCLRAENQKLWNEKKWCERDVIKAEADTARLDWLDENMGYSGGGSGGTYTFFTPADVECGMLRDAIDAAMKEDSK
jgi:hypothetical protein